MKLLIPSILLVCCCLFSLTASAQLVSDSIEIEKKLPPFSFQPTRKQQKEQEPHFCAPWLGRKW